MSKITALIREDREFRSVAEAFCEQMRAKLPLPLAVNGLSGGATLAFLTEALLDARAQTGAPVLILVHNEEARDLTVRALCDEGIDARAFRGRDLIFHNISASRDIERERLSVLFDIVNGRCDAVVTTLSAAMTATLPPTALLSHSVDLRLGDTIPLDELTERLIRLGYSRADMVESRGQFAVRGGIVDIFAGACEVPVRVEFFGDEIDRMEYFDPITQRVSGPSSALTLLPATEVLLDEAARARILKTLDALISSASEETVREQLSRDRRAIEEGLSSDTRDRYLGVIYDGLSTLFSYFDAYARPAVFVLGYKEVKAEYEGVFTRLTDEGRAMLSKGLIKEKCIRYIATEGALDDFLGRCVTLHVNPFAGGVGTMKLGGLFGFRVRRTVSYGDNGRMLAEDLLSLRRGLYRVLIVCENKQGAASLCEGLSTSDISTVPIYDKPDFSYDKMTPGGIYVTVGRVREGFELVVPKIAVLSMYRDTGRAVLQNRRRARILKKAGGATQRLLSYADLSVGDYVVHANYGIGLFEGIETVKVDGVLRDYITIRYQGTDKLFVPCDTLDMIGKYIGARDEDGKVKLSRMGGADWTRAKSRAKAGARDIARDLIRLYAERQRRPGFAFGADTEMEREFAESFEYEETESQLQAIEEIKRDMMRPVPMNRLLCGDVGFGKTEVALRAVFKAIMSNKQVAILVPTTILALQHYQTILSRMRGYPVTVEMLCRFRTPREQEKILRRTKRGEIDVLVGTHRLLSKGIEFRDLGLLVVDEEQRFGVSQKEKLKQMAGNIDVLTLSATPIPRTLNMAMNGISDMSILDEAPGERLPVETYVAEHDDVLIGDAIAREFARGGQVLYLYNRVEDIHVVAGRLQNAFPMQRITYAHGQMEREELEDIWQALVRGEIDMIVCTTIIETGVDLPGANTLIIENADRMGLSQLHQLRGRVGRGARQAYAYFTYRPGKSLSEVATKRLSIIREFTRFGAGFRIALRDLEIRGAGNLLGAEQHGYIESVGYDLYLKLLAEAVLEERGESKGAATECKVDIRLDACLSKEFIPVDSQRMEMYKRISLIATVEDKRDVEDELCDRFGTLPKSAERLLGISLIRATASRVGISRVLYDGTSLTFFQEKPDLAVWSELFIKYRGLAFRTVGAPSVTYRVPRGADPISLATEILLEYERLCVKESDEEVLRSGKESQNEEK